MVVALAVAEPAWWLDQDAEAGAADLTTISSPSRSTTTVRRRIGGWRLPAQAAEESAPVSDRLNVCDLQASTAVALMWVTRV